MFSLLLFMVTSVLGFGARGANFFVLFIFVLFPLLGLFLFKTLWVGENIFSFLKIIVGCTLGIW